MDADRQGAQYRAAVARQSKKSAGFSPAEKVPRQKNSGSSIR
jgi:hypothetical protein